jgi:hypothetical protein
MDKKSNFIKSIISILFLGMALVSCIFSQDKSQPPLTPKTPATKFGTVEWSSYARFSGEIPADFYIGGWTHTTEPIGFAGTMSGYSGTGNDYPFVIECSNTVNGAEQLILMISGNIGYDEGRPGWTYNQNITSNTGDYSTIYYFADEPGYSAGFPDEAMMRGWVYVAWHYRYSAEGTKVNQYIKFGIDGAVLKIAEDTIDGTGVFDGSNPDPVQELVVPRTLCVGGGSRGWAPMHMQYVKVYERSSVPSLQEVNQIALMTTADTSAWADWPLVGGSLADVSGNGRDLAAAGVLSSSIEGPFGD